jgi:hypothetical protein
MAIRKVIPRSLDSAAASANLSFDANTLYVDSTNNAVGINLTNPSSYATGGLATYNATNSSLAIVSGNANAYLRLYSTSDTDMYLSNIGGKMTFTTAANARMYIDSSGNVGIGAAAPAAKLEVSSATGSATPTPTEIRISTTTNAADWSTTLPWGRLGYYSADVSTFGPKLAASIDVIANASSGGAASLVFNTIESTAGTLTERMRITNLGDVGIGTNSVTGRLNVFDSAVAGFTAITTFSGLNSAAEKTDYVQFKPSIELNTAAGEAGGYTILVKQQGAYKNSIVASGVTNNASNYLAFSTTSEAMRIDSTGQVGIGIAPSFPVHISYPLARMYMSSSTGTNYVSYSANNTGGGFAFGIDNSGGNNFGMATAYGRAIFSDGAYPIGIFTNGTERMRIDSAGRVGIGGGTPASNPKLSMYGGIRFMSQEAAANTYTGIGSIVSDTVSISTSGSEQMRVDTVGRVMIGYLGANARASAAKLELKSAVNTALSIYMFKDTQVEVNMGFAGSTDSNFYINSGSTTIGASGVYLTNNGTSWNAVSDERMKTIVEPITNAAEKVSSLRTVIGYYNNDEKQIHRPFLIAQDVQAVLPEAVNVQNIETGTLGMSYTDVIPLLVAAIKEQQAIIAQLQADVAALQAK